MFEIRKADMKDVDDVLNHYKEVINQIKDNEFNPGWRYDIYPKEKNLINSIKSGNMYIGLIDSRIVSSIIIDHIPIHCHDTINWNIHPKEDEIYYVHLVAVNQDYRKQGLASKLLKFAFDLSKENGVKCIRLSINKNNIPIEKLYKRHGFIHVDSIEVDDEDRGLLFFEIYEKIIQ